MSNVLIACGGTGGHLSPGIALAQELIARKHTCILLVTKKLVDKKLSQAYPDIHFKYMSGMGLPSKFYRWPQFLFLNLKSLFQTLWLLKKYHIEAVLAFGGFSSLGAVLGAWIFRKPCFLHEANQRPGKAIRLLSRFATQVYLPKGVFLEKPLTRIQHLGFPVRKEICKIDKNLAREQLGLPPDQRVLVVVGGSQGASVFNRWVIEHFKTLGEHRINIICVTGFGGRQEETIEEEYAGGWHSKLIFIPFALNMHVLFSAADLVLSRAGAGTIAELTCCETPSILIPYPFAMDNHQDANALYFEKKGGCLRLKQEKMESDLLNEVLQLIENDELLACMRRDMSRLNNEDAAQLIANDLESFLQ